MTKKLIELARKIRNRYNVEEALNIIECVLEEHVPGRYTITETKTTITATSLSGKTSYTWEVEGMDENLLHCSAHAFCADVLMEE